MFGRKPLIRYVYFDLGHVVVPLKRDVFCEGLASVSDLPKAQLAEILGKGYTSSEREYWDLACESDRGIIYPHEFYERMSKVLRLNTDFHTLIKIWQSILGVDDRFLALIEKLAKQNIKSGIISDLSVIHYNKFKELVDQSIFGARFFSFMEGRLKKEDGGETFRRAVYVAGVKAKEILFVDDRPENLLAAEHNGMRTFLYNDPSYEDNFGDLVDELKRLRVKL
jgi:FMN phosphatase YigB (HAD superfamily)